MAKRIISFEIDEEVEGHLFALAEDWGKGPVELAKALFVEELMAHTAGSRGVKLLRRYMYRDAGVYFTPEESTARAAKREIYWATPEGLAIRESQQQNLEIFKALTAKTFEKRKSI